MSRHWLHLRWNAVVSTVSSVSFILNFAFVNLQLDNPRRQPQKVVWTHFDISPRPVRNNTKRTTIVMRRGNVTLSGQFAVQPKQIKSKACPFRFLIPRPNESSFWEPRFILQRNRTNSHSILRNATSNRFEWKTAPANWIMNIREQGEEQRRGIETWKTVHWKLHQRRKCRKNREWMIIVVNRRK
jgi:hypothetical protein